MSSNVRLVRPLRNGQITIPLEFRRELGIAEHTIVQVQLVGQELRIRAVETAVMGPNYTWARDLYELLAPVRVEARDRPQADIYADIDRAVAAARRENA